MGVCKVDVRREGDGGGKSDGDDGGESKSGDKGDRASSAAQP